MQRNVLTLVCLLLTALGAAAEDAAKPPSLQTGVILADKAVDKTLTPLVAEYNRLSNTNLKLTFLSSGDLAARLVRKDPHAVIAVAIAARPDAKPPAGGKTVAWTPK
ncbi:MAG: hypothetical protein QGG69_08355, partial [Kiritimatiellia bacterium]|nr:hypothetical protein [Kiritimatiellia bacterium]